MFFRILQSNKLKLIILILILSVFACARGVRKEDQGDRFFFDRGMKFMEKKNYESAIQDFQTVVDTGTSDIMDQAQYMLGEAHYKNEDYLTAAFEYTRVYMDFPSSEYAAEAWYKKAMCFFMESPRANLDQENTQLAIDEFNRFIDNFPRHELVSEAQKKIAELREKLAYKDYRNGELYRRMKEYTAALIYYESVIKQFPKTVWIHYCRYSMGIVHVKLMENEKKKLKKLERKENIDEDKSKEIKFNISKEYNEARELFTIVINSEAETDLKKKASEKLSDLEEYKIPNTLEAVR
ncbi:MAG: outer membrane protein assembly factor BamD [Candidatus Latescibacteria bacterium]|nr:outer membrane protein assembly factor BamD [Candidatus Latescibacterota bacterium]